MEADLDTEVENLKHILTTLLTGLGGCSSIRALGRTYFENFGKYIVLEKFGVKKFIELLKNFRDVFKVYNKAGNIFVELRERPDLSIIDSKEESVTSNDKELDKCCTSARLKSFEDIKRPEITKETGNIEQEIKFPNAVEGKFRKFEQESNENMSKLSKKTLKTGRPIRYIAKERSFWDPIEVVPKTTSDFHDTTRPPSPAPSTLSMTLSEFLDANIPTSTPVPSDIDAESVKGDFLEELTEIDSDESLDELNKTFCGFQKTPEIVKNSNPFLPPLVRISNGEIFGDDKEESLKELNETLKFAGESEVEKSGRSRLGSRDSRKIAKDLPGIYEERREDFDKIQGNVEKFGETSGNNEQNAGGFHKLAGNFQADTSGQQNFQGFEEIQSETETELEDSDVSGEFCHGYSNFNVSSDASGEGSETSFSYKMFHQEESECNGMKSLTLVEDPSEESLENDEDDKELEASGNERNKSDQMKSEAEELERKLSNLSLKATKTNLEKIVSESFLIIDNDLEIFEEYSKVLKEKHANVTNVDQYPSKLPEKFKENEGNSTKFDKFNKNVKENCQNRRKLEESLRENFQDVHQNTQEDSQKLEGNLRNLSKTQKSKEDSGNFWKTQENSRKYHQNFQKSHESVKIFGKVHDISRELTQNFNNKPQILQGNLENPPQNFQENRDTSQLNVDNSDIQEDFDEIQEEIFNKMHGDSDTDFSGCSSFASSFASSSSQCSLHQFQSDGDSSDSDNHFINDNNPEALKEFEDFLEEGSKPAAIANPKKPEDDAEDYQNSLKYFVDNVVDDEVFLWKFPPVVRDATVKVKNEVVPLDTEFKVHISEMYSPVRFWFHHEDGVTKLMDQLQRDYNDLKPDDLKISDVNIVPGLLLACYYHETKQWHRVQVIEPLNSSGQARVLFFDYGSIGRYHKRNFKYLFEKYLNYPRYANRGSLKGLKPPGKEYSWTEEQVSKILVRFCSKAMTGKVLRHVEDDNSYELDINHVDSKGQLINLRKWVLQKEVAEEFALLLGNILPFWYTIEDFDVLERRYPTFHQKSVMNRQGIDFNLLLETNFLLNVYDEKTVMKPGVLKMLGNKKFKEIKEYHFG